MEDGFNQFENVFIVFNEYDEEYKDEVIDYVLDDCIPEKKEVA